MLRVNALSNFIIRKGTRASIWWRSFIVLGLVFYRVTKKDAEIEDFNHKTCDIGSILNTYSALAIKTQGKRQFLRNFNAVINENNRKIHIILA